MGLNKEQLKIAENGAMGHALIRGIAGSGKTTVGVQRIFYLIENCCREDDQVLFLTYNKSLCKYVEYIYKEMKEEQPLTLSTLMADETENTSLEVRTVDAVAMRYFKAATQHTEVAISWTIPDNLFAEALETIQKAYPKCTLLAKRHKKFLMDEIAWMKGCGYKTLAVYQEAERIGRGSGAQGEERRKLQKNAYNREAIFALREEIDRCLKTENKVDILTANQLARDYIMAHKAGKHYKHIIIDEAQDLTKVQLEMINSLKADTEESSILFLMDVAQSIYPQAWLVKGRAFKTIGYDMTGKGYKLSKNYRTTTEISQCAYSLLANDINLVEDEYFVKPSLLERHGDYPIYRHFEDSKEQNHYVIRLIKALSKTYALKDIAVVCKFNKSLELLYQQLEDNQVPAMLFKSVNKDMDFARDEVKLLTMHSIKGLEFKVVLLIDLNKNIIPYYQEGLTQEEQGEDELMERKLLYVGMTRAQEKLFMFSYGEASKFIRQIDRNFLSMQVDARINAFYQLPYEQYLFLDKIKRKEDAEESVRQWMLQELIQNYGYPESLIEVEYHVQVFSQTGKVDIAIINAKTKEPYLFVETKQQQEPIENAIKQLQSYMNAAGVPYGIATNGKNIAFLDGHFNRIKDIPVCSITVLPTSVECYKYVDKRTYREYAFARDVNVKEVIVEDTIIKEEELQTLPIYADIAAGVPIEIVDEMKGKFSLPIEWTKNKASLYMLKVRGDSMIGAGIDNGDYVVIDAELAVNTQDIGAVYYNGATTLKRVVPMDNTILLLSENAAYGPIQLSEGEFKIQGKLVGVVKSIG